MGSYGHEEGMEVVDLGDGLRTWHGRSTGRNEVLKPNCYDEHEEGIEGVDQWCGLRKVGVRVRVEIQY